MLGPNGEILHTGPFAGVSFGERDGKPARPALVALDAACKKAGIDGGLNPTSTRISGTSGSCWARSPRCARLMRGTSGDILEAGEGQAIMLETVEECRKVAAAAGCDPGDKGMANVRSYLTQKGSSFAASMLHDLEKGVDGRGRSRRGRHDGARAQRPASPRPTCASPTPICRPIWRAARAAASASPAM